MKRFTNSIIIALQVENWYGALTLALTLPDICGRKKGVRHYLVTFIKLFDGYFPVLFTQLGIRVHEFT